MAISMGRRNVGEGENVYIVCEAGPTHNGLESAKKLAAAAKEAGADAIKFQIADHKRLITTKDVPFSYGIVKTKDSKDFETITEPLIDIWERRYMPREDWSELKKYCDQLDIDFFATIFFEEDVDFLVDLGVASLKIASQDIEHEDLIRYCAKKGLPIQLDTGSASLAEVERAVNWCNEEGNEKIIINHCPSGYPARVESIHLRMLQTLKQMYPTYAIAFSDHTPGWSMDIAARAVGADIIEKTITLDRTTRSCEHVMSIEPDDIKEFVADMRDLDIAMGENRRVLTREQIDKAQAVRRSGFLVKPVKSGEALTREHFDFRRPGFGVVQPPTYKNYLGRTFNKDLEIGHMINNEDLN